MGIKDNIEKQLPKESKMIDTDEIREQLCEAMTASWPDDSDEPRPEAVKAINDFDEIVKAFESLPVFEDTGERFVPGISNCWIVWPECSIAECLNPQYLLCLKRWAVESFNTRGDAVYKFYSTKEAAEAARKGGE